LLYQQELRELQEQLVPLDQKVRLVQRGLQGQAGNLVFPTLHLQVQKMETCGLIQQQR
jgi:hypothetical protein